MYTIYSHILVSLVHEKRNKLAIGTIHIIIILYSTYILCACHSFEGERNQYSVEYLATSI